MISHQQWRAAFNRWLQSPSGRTLCTPAEVQRILDLRESGAIGADEALRRLGIEIRKAATV